MKKNKTKTNWQSLQCEKGEKSNKAQQDTGTDAPENG